MFMKRTTCKLLSALSFVFASMLFGVANAQIAPQGSETVANTTVVNSQQHAGVAMDSTGNYVVVWESFDQDGEQYGIYYQRFDAGGTANGTETLVNSTTTSSQRHPHVAMDGSGRCAITYTSDLQDGDGQGVYLRAYDQNFNIIQSAYRVNSGSTGNQMHSRVAMGPGGQMVAVYMGDNTDGDGYGIFYRPFDESFNALSSSTQVNVTTTGDQMHPDVAITGGGNFGIVWQSNSGTDSDGKGIYMQVYDYNRSVVTSEFQVNTTTAGNQQEPAIAADHNGNFMVVWSSYTQDGDSYGVYGRIYNSSGVAQTAEFLINTTTSGDQGHASVTATQEGTFYVSWTDDGADGDRSGVYVQGILSDGSFYGTETRLNTTTANYQQFSEIAIFRDDVEMVAAWQDGFRNSAAGLDGDDYAVVTQRLSAADVTDPVAVCQNITVYLDGTGNVTVSGVDVDGGSTDNVGVVSTTLNTTAFTCNDLGNNNVTLTVADAAGNTDMCVAVITVLDSISPTIACQDATVYLDGSGTAIITSSSVLASSSDNCGIVSISTNDTTFTCTDVGANTVTVTAVDASGNSSQCTATVTVADSTGPTASCQNLSLYLDGAGNATLIASDLDNGSTDNCAGTLNFSASQTAFTCSDIGANSVTLTVTDGDGNASTCVSTVTVIDSVAPTAVCQNLTVYLDGSGNATITSADIDGGSSDNCGSVALTSSQTTFSCTDIGTVPVTLTVMDGSTNSSQCVATVTVADTISPTVACQNITVYLDGTGNATINTGDINNGSSDNCTTSPALSLDITSFSCAELGTNTVTLTAVDDEGNSASCTATVTVIDSTAPAASCQNITAYLDGTGNVTIAAADVDNGSSDNCGSTTLSLDVSTFTCADIGANTVTLTATDGSSNSATCTGTVTVVDSMSPTALCQNTTIYLDGSGNATITAADIDGGSTDNCTSVTLNASQTAFTCADAGANTVTLTVTDGNANSSTCTATVTVVDSTAPTALCQNISVYLDGSGNATIAATDLDGGSTDNCGGTLTYGASQTTFTCADIGTNTITLTVSDGSNSATCTAVVTVLDSIAPTAVCQDATVYLDGSGFVTITGATIDGGSTDNCNGSPALSVNTTLFDCSNIGANTVTLTADDGNGNSSTCTATVTVLDSMAPTAVCQNITVYLDGAGNASITAADLDGGSADNCTTISLSASQTAFTCTDLGTNSVTLTVTDGSSNSSTCVAVVTVADSTAPTAVCQNINAYLDGSGNVTIAAADLDGGSSDNCGTVSLSANITAFTCADLGANSVTLTVDDGNGNSATCVSVVTVIDSVSPVVTCPGNQVENFDASCQFTVPDYTSMGSATDNCGGTLTITQSPVSGTVISGNTTITLSVTDANGNTGSCTFDVVPNDATPPVITCPADQTGIVGVGCVFMVPDYTGMATATDNCGIPTVTQNPAAGTMVGAGVTLITLTASDGLNLDSCSFNLTVSGPTASFTSVTNGCTNDSVYFTDASTNAVSWEWDFGNGETSTLQNPGTMYVGAGSYDVTLIVGNGNGCFDTLVMSNYYTVNPPIAALLATPTTGCTVPHVVTFTDQSTSPDTWFWEFGDAQTSNLQNPSHTYTALGTYNGLLTVTNTTFGCTDTASFTIVVEDLVAPSITCPSNDTVFADANCQSMLSDYTGAAVVTDLCDPNPTVTQIPTAGTMLTGSGLTTVTLYATDLGGNIDSCSFTVLLSDSTAPIISCPADTNVVADANCMMLLGDFTSLATTSDNCDATPAVTQSPAAGTSVSGAGTVTTVTLYSTDASGNVDSCSFNVTLMDGTAPTFACPAADTVIASGACTASLADYTTSIVVTDNCDANPVVTQSPTPGTMLSGAGSTTSVTIYATDASGNVDSCSFNVVLADSMAPSITCPGDTTIDLVACSYTLADFTGMAVTVDSCDANPTVTQSPAAGTVISSATTTTVTLTSTDASGNSASCTFLVVTRDVLDPVISCASDTVSCDSLLTYVMPTATDDCSGVTVAQIAGLPSGGPWPVGITVNTFVATDASGNTDTCSFTVEVLHLPPSANAGGDQALCEATDATLTANPPGPGNTGMWTALNGGTFADPSMSNTTISGLSAGNSYQFVWTISNGLCSTSDTITIDVDAMPDAGFTFVDDNGDIIFTPNYQSGTATYAWDFGGQGNSTQMIDTIALTPGDYTICLTVTEGACDSTHCETIFINTSIGEPGLALGGFNVYPNPFRGETNVAYTLRGDAEVQLQVLDMTGRLVDQMVNGQQSPGEYIYTFDGSTSSVESGIYMVQLIVDGQLYSKRLIELD